MTEKNNANAIHHIDTHIRRCRIDTMFSQVAVLFMSQFSFISSCSLNVSTRLNYKCMSGGRILSVRLYVALNFTLYQNWMCYSMRMLCICFYTVDCQPQPYQPRNLANYSVYRSTWTCHIYLIFECDSSFKNSTASDTAHQSLKIELASFEHALVMLKFTQCVLYLIRNQNFYIEIQFGLNEKRNRINKNDEIASQTNLL